MLLGLPRYRLWIVRRFDDRLGNGGSWLPLGISWADRCGGVEWSKELQEGLSIKTIEEQGQKKEATRREKRGGLTGMFSDQPSL